MTNNNKITPDGLIFRITSLEVQNNILHLTLNFPPEYNITFPLTMFLFFYFKNDDRSILVQQERINSASPDGIYRINISLNSEVEKALALDPHPVIYLALAGQPEKKKVYWTGTVITQL